MESERLDLSALDPSQDPQRWESMIARVMERAGAELAFVIRVVAEPLCSQVGTDRLIWKTCREKGAPQVLGF